MQADRRFPQAALSRLMSITVRLPAPTSYQALINQLISAHGHDQIIDTERIAHTVAIQHPDIDKSVILKCVTEEAIRSCKTVVWGKSEG